MQNIQVGGNLGDFRDPGTGQPVALRFFGTVTCYSQLDQQTLQQLVNQSIKTGLATVVATQFFATIIFNGEWVLII